MQFLQTFQLDDFFDTLVSLFIAFAFGTLIGAEEVPGCERTFLCQLALPPLSILPPGSAADFR